MNDWLNMSPYVRPLLGLLAIVFAFFLVKFLIRQVFAMIKLGLTLALLAIAAVFYLDYTGYFGPSKIGGALAAGELDSDSEAEQTTQRQIFAQIVDAEDNDHFGERAILEGRTLRYLVKRVSKMESSQIRKMVDDRTTFENLQDEPDLHRGEPYFAARGVIVEEMSFDLTPDYGFPPGWTILKAAFVNTGHEVYALRILCPPGSTLHKRLEKGIADDQLPVVMVSGLFFKNHARKTSDPKEPPWVKPLLVCPEPEFVAKEEPRQVFKELQEAGYSKLLPSRQIDAPATPERLVLEVAMTKGSADLRAWGETSVLSGMSTPFLKKAVEKLKQRLPAESVKDAAAVLLVRGAESTDERVVTLTKELKALGVSRINFKKDTGTTANQGK